MRGDPPGNLEFFLTLALTTSKVWPLVQREFAAEDVDPVHWGLLFHAGARDDVTPSELAAETGLSATTTRDNIQALVDRGLVERDPNPQDARSYYVRLTRQGRRDLERGIVAARRLEKRIAARFDGTEALRDSLYALMAVLADLTEQDELAERARRVETVLARRAGGSLRRMAIDPRVDIGHVHLKVSDLERALGFYVGVLGFDVFARYGEEAAFISAGGYHHHIGLNTWESKGGVPPPRNTTGLYHTAIRYPDRKALADALRRVLAAGIRLDGASDHGVSIALYLRDPDENGVELYYDRPQSEWPRDAEGKPTMFTKPVDLDALLADA